MLNTAHSSALKAEQLGGEDQDGRSRRPGRYSVTPSTMPRMMTRRRIGTYGSRRVRFDAAARETAAANMPSHSGGDRAERRRADPERVEARRPFRRHCRAGASATGPGSAARRAGSRSATSASVTGSGTSTSPGSRPAGLEDLNRAARASSAPAGRRSHRSLPPCVAGSTAATAIACARSSTKTGWNRAWARSPAGPGAAAFRRSGW